MRSFIYILAIYCASVVNAAPMDNPQVSASAAAINADAVTSASHSTQRAATHEHVESTHKASPDLYKPHQESEKKVEPAKTFGMSTKQITASLARLEVQEPSKKQSDETLKIRALMQCAANFEISGGNEAAFVKYSQSMRTSLHLCKAAF